MKKISLVFGLLVVLCTYSKAQDTCTPKRIFEYTDESKKTIIIKELLVYSKQEKNTCPLHTPLTYSSKHRRRVGQPWVSGFLILPVSKQEKMENCFGKDRFVWIQNSMLFLKHRLWESGGLLN